MKIVIDISEGEYELVQHGDEFSLEELKDLLNAIIKGKPLPKGHGRLIDGDKVLDDIEKKYPASVSETEKRKKYASLVYYWAVKNAPTIIDTDKEVNADEQ